MATVFLSYTHQDSILAERVQIELEASGHKVWRDVTHGELSPGKLIPSIVAGGLETSDFLALVITKNALSSRWMLQEVNTFLMDNSKWDKVIPLRFDETKVEDFHGLLRSVLYADLREFSSGIKKVLERLGPSGKRDSASDDDSRSRLPFAIDLALRCGNVVMRYYNSSIVGNRTLDERRNAMTAADRAAQHEVESALLQHRDYKEDTFVGEEPPHNRTKPSVEGYTWVVDPLDGTVNFENRIPYFCTAIGVLREGSPYLGVIYAPVTNEVYFAVEGTPARIWDISRGEVALISADQGTRELQKCVVGTHISSRPNVASKLFERRGLQDVGRRVRHLRALGCGQLALAYIASGRLQVFFQYGSYLWDQVAGVVLVRNSTSGVVLRLPSGLPWTHTAREFLAAGNEAVGQELLGVIGSARDKGAVRRRSQRSSGRKPQRARFRRSPL